MAYILNQARTKQRSLVITLLDLKNAFGEVHHNVIQFVLCYHHIPGHIKILTSTRTLKRQLSHPNLTPLLFMLVAESCKVIVYCFLDFIQHKKSNKYRQFGFPSTFLNPLHWFQLADDAAVITGQQSENQHLLNRFAIWCQWSDIIIRVDKCSTFGIKKALTKSVQYLPKLIINNSLIPAIELGKSFCYLGRYFDFEMSNKEHKSELISNLTKLMTDIDLKSLHPKNKIVPYSCYVLSKPSWHLTVADLSKTLDFRNP